MSLFKIAHEIPTGLLWGSGSGAVFLILVISTGATRWLTRHHVKWGLLRKEFRTKESCEDKQSRLEQRITDLDKNINQNMDRQFKVVIELIKKNGR